jgi:hypothetical protein
MGVPGYEMILIFKQLLPTMWEASLHCWLATIIRAGTRGSERNE